MEEREKKSNNQSQVHVSYTEANRGRTIYGVTGQLMTQYFHHFEDSSGTAGPMNIGIKQSEKGSKLPESEIVMIQNVSIEERRGRYRIKE